MHPTAKQNCTAFYESYHNDLLAINPFYEIVEIGSQDVNGNLRGIFPPGVHYTGVDFVDGKGVDVILTDPYKLPFEDNSIDVIISSSCFEHSEMFWLMHLEIMRVLKPHGLFYFNAPSNGDVHRWPVDCWRFYPDAGNALVTWANRNGHDSVLLESYTSARKGDIWNDFVSVFLKDKDYVDSYPNRIIDIKTDIWNGVKHGTTDVVKPATISEDQKMLEVIKKIIVGDISVS
jgi:SAM-dependent methyltransferase